jgi:hypothetical protein
MWVGSLDMGDDEALAAGAREYMHEHWTCVQCGDQLLVNKSGREAHLKDECRARTGVV